ncbi:helix-turn-helix transcriptional regulator [Streptomyces broussonetiae]|uniref:AAA family ATPase n=1 Tax=Streptomyces broussonetiae TaxID=2686304 RepID=A0A6I6MYH2_9ACTN|nr:LuxR family transcriptional regulator [Streptomyces broussonetiae]QHA03339.1 AAA family ATPase [Streptomyces broussonetiae]
MQLFGRSRELQALGEAYVDSTGGHGRLVIITGGPGSGKTQLMHEFLTTLNTTDARILTGTTWSGERDQPMSLMGQLLRNAEAECAASHHTPSAVNSQQKFRRPKAPWHLPGHAPGGDETAEGLLRLAGHDRPLVIAVDDAHAMDRASLHTIVRLLRRSRSRPVLVVCATSGHFGETRSPAHTELLRQPHRRVRLAPLSDASVGELLAAQAGRALPGDVRSAYHRATAGSPLLVHALLDDSTRLGPDIGHPVAGAAYRQAVLSLLHRGEAGHVRVARALAALGSLAGCVPVGELTGTTPAGTQEAVDALNSSGLLDGHVFRHPTAAAAVLEDMDGAERTGLHGRIAHTLYRSGAPALEVARHLHAADLVPEGWGAGILRAAAEQALAVDDLDRCTAYLGLVLRDCTDERERHALSVALARAEWRTNPAAAGPHLQPLRAPALDGDLSMRDTATVLRHMLWQGDTELAAQAVASLVHPHSPAEAQIVAEVEFVRQWFYGVALPGKGAPASAADPRRRPAHADTGLAARVAALVGGEATDESAAAVAQALQGHQLDHLNLELVAMSLLAIAHADRPALAAEACDALLECAVDRRATTWQALLGSIRAEIALLQGDVTTAAQGALAALGTLRAQSWGVLIGLPLSTAIAAHTAMGSYAEAEELLGLDVPEPMFRTVFGIQYLRARGHHYLATDRPFAALNDFETCGRLLREGNPSLQKGIPWRSDLALANLRIGKARSAREWAEEQLRLPGGHSSRARAMALCLLAATSKPHRRASLLREAIDLLKTCGDRYALAQAYADLSAAHYELGEYDRARLVARRAAAEAEACRIESPVDAHLLQDPVRPEKTEPKDGPAILSDAECRVAGLAALGYTNREISGRLHVTISTVEQHLTRVYRKLQVASRSELPSKMLEHRIPKLSDRWASTHSSAG